MYDVLKHGARLDSEIFPESINRRSWPTETAYAAFLREREVDYVLISNAYDKRYRTNEHALLESLVARTHVGTPFPGDVERVLQADGYSVYHVCWQDCAGAAIEPRGLQEDASVRARRLQHKDRAAESGSGLGNVDRFPIGCS